MFDARLIPMLALVACAAAMAQSTPPQTVDPTVQAGRDDERLRILNAELVKEVAALQAATDSASRERSAGDIAALKREIELAARRSGASLVAAPAMAERRQKSVVQVPLAFAPVVMVRAQESAATPTNTPKQESK